MGITCCGDTVSESSWLPVMLQSLAVETPGEIDCRCRVGCFLVIKSAGGAGRLEMLRELTRRRFGISAGNDSNAAARLLPTLLLEAPAAAALRDMQTDGAVFRGSRGCEQRRGVSLVHNLLDTLA